MKRLLLIAAFLGIGLTVSAQGEYGSFFVGGGAGINVGVDGHKYEDRPTSHSGSGWAADVYAGGWFTPSVGTRIGYHGLSISDRYTDFGKDMFRYIHADVLFRAHRNIIPYVHGGYVSINYGSAAAGAGVMFPIHVGKHIAIVPDLKVTGYSSRTFVEAENNLAANFSATVGIAFSFGKSRKKAARVVDVVTVPPQRPARDTVVVRDTVIIEKTIHEKDTVYMHPEKISALALFDTDSSVLREEVYPELSAIANWFRAHPGATAVIEGHTDSTASAEYNMWLSLRRAKSVYNYLVGCGIEPSRLRYEGYGLTRPVDTNATPEGRQRNRRVEIHVEEGNGIGK